MKYSGERERLLGAVHDSRCELREGLLEVREAADLASRVKASVQKNFVWWIGGSLLVGIFVASATDPGGKAIETKTGEKLSEPRKRSLISVFSKLIRFLLSVSSPVLKTLLTREVATALSKIEWPSSDKS